MTKREHDFELLWIDVAEFTALCAVVGYVLYLFGWSYLYGYLGYFGLSLTEVDLDFREVIVYGARSALWPWIYAVLGVLLIGTLIVGKWLHKNAHAGRPEKAWWFRTVVASGALAAILGTSIYSQFKGDSDAKGVQENPGCQLPNVKIFADGGGLPPEMGLPAASGMRELSGRLLVHGKRGYFVFNPLDNQALQGLLASGLGGATVELPISFIPNESVRGAVMGTCVELTRPKVAEKPKELEKPK